MVTITTCRPCASTWIFMERRPPPSATGQPGHDHDLAVRLPVRQQADRLHAPLERQALGDARLEPAGAVPSQQLLDRPVELVGRVPSVVAELASERRAVLHEEPVRGNLLDPADEPD